MMMNRGIFITGTDTGVGKTFVAAGLIKAIREKGFSVCPMKPVETGCRLSKGRLIPGDAGRLLKVSGFKEPLDVVNPYRFRLPLAPAMAAEREGTVIRKSKILSLSRRLMKKYDFTVIEGAGGIMVPVYKRYLYLDMIKDIGLPLLIIARPGLGTINHTLLTIKAARSKGISICGVIINSADRSGKDTSVENNPEIIEKLGKVQVIGKIPFFRSSSSLRLKAVFRKIAEQMVSL